MYKFMQLVHDHCVNEHQNTFNLSARADSNVCAHGIYDAYVAHSLHAHKWSYQHASYNIYRWAKIGVVRRVGRGVYQFDESRYNDVMNRRINVWR